jgi:hypothetical protein
LFPFTHLEENFSDFPPNCVQNVARQGGPTLDLIPGEWLPTALISRFEDRAAAVLTFTALPLLGSDGSPQDVTEISLKIESKWADRRKK